MLRVFENRVLRRACGPKSVEVRGDQKNFIMGTFMICTLWGDQIQADEMWHVWEIRKMLTDFWWRNVKEGDHMVDIDIEGRVLWKWVLRK